MAAEFEDFTALEYDHIRSAVLEHEESAKFRFEVVGTVIVAVLPWGEYALRKMKRSGEVFYQIVIRKTLQHGTANWHDFLYLIRETIQKHGSMVAF